MSKKELIDNAIQVFGSAEKAERWLNKSKASLNGEKPIKLLERGETEVIQEMLERIVSGYF